MEWKWFFFADTLHIPTGPGWKDPDDTPSWFWSSIGDAIDSAISGLLSALLTPFNLIGSALDSIGEGMMSIGNSIWSYFVEPLTDIWTSIKSLPSAIVSGIQDMLTFIFVPDEDFFADKFESLKGQFSDKLGVSGDEINQLKNVSAGSYTGISDFEGTLHGKTMKFVDLSILDGFIDRIHNLARGFMFPLLIFYNLNQIYFLVRGVNLYGTGGGRKE